MLASKGIKQKFLYHPKNNWNKQIFSLIFHEEDKRYRDPRILEGGENYCSIKYHANENLIH